MPPKRVRNRGSDGGEPQAYSVGRASVRHGHEGGAGSGFLSVRTIRCSGAP